MDRCPKCFQLVGDGLGVHYDSDVVRDGRATIDALRRQLAAANERAGRLQAQMVELQKAWDILRHDDFVVNGGDRVNWNAHDEAKANIDRILGGA